MEDRRFIEKSETDYKAKEIGFGNEVFQTIYLVFGSATEGSPMKWNIKFYEDKDSANEHVKKATEYVDQMKEDIRLGKQKNTHYIWSTPYDPEDEDDDEDVAHHFWSTKYAVKEIKLIKSVTK